MKKLLIILLITLSLGGYGQKHEIGLRESGQRPGINLVTNGTPTSSSTTGWSVNELTLTSITSDGGVVPPNGTYMFKGVDAGTSAAYQTVTTVAGKSYTIGVYYYLPSANTGTGFNVQIYDGAGFNTGNQVITYAKTTEDQWVFIQVVFTATTTTSTLHFKGPSTTSDIMYFTNVVIREYNATSSDLISGIAGTNTNVVVVQGKGGEGSDRYNSYNGTSSFTSIADNDNLDFGTGNFSIYFEFTPANITQSGKYLFNKEAGGIGYGVYQTTNDLYLRLDDNTTDVSGIIGTDVLVAGTKYKCAITFTRSGNAVLYVNGVSSGTVAISTASLTINNSGALVLADSTGGSKNWAGNIYQFELFNRALSIGEVQAYSRATTTTPNLVSGLRYRILTVGTANWTSIGAASAATGVEFSCNTTAQTGTGTATPLSNYLTFADKGATNTEVITNGTFVSDVSGWSVGGGATITWNAGEYADLAGFTTTSDQIYQGIPQNDGYYFKASATISNYSGGGALVRIRIDNARATQTGSITDLTIANITGNGTFTGYFWSSTSTETLKFVGYSAGGATTFSIDNVSVIRLGNTLNLDASGIRPTTWYDPVHAITGTNTAVTPVIPAGSELKAMDFNGTTSAIAYTGMNGLTGDVSIAGWASMRGYGENGVGTIFSNSKIGLITQLSGLWLIFYRDNATQVNSAASIYLNSKYHYCVTSTSTGVTNFYINGVLSGTANQAAGTPVSGTTWYVGNRTGTDRTFDGMLSPIRIYSRVLTSDEVLELYNQSK